GRELDRERARCRNTALDRLQEFREVAMAVVEARSCIGDPDDGLRQRRPRIAHGLGEGAAQIERKILVAVIGEAVPEAHRRFSHRAARSSRSSLLWRPVADGAPTSPQGRYALCRYAL